MKRYYGHDYIEYKGIRGIKNLIDLSIDEHYYEQIKANDAFNGKHIEYESKGD